MHLVRATALKPGVPASLSTSNSYTAATPIALDDAPFCLRIRLLDPNPCRTSRPVSGDVHIFGPRESKPSLSPSSLDISRLSIRIYYESRTTFWEIRPADGHDRPSQAPIIQRIGRAQRQEVHRGVAAGVTRTSWSTNEPFTLPFKDTLLGRPHATLPFSFTLPPRMDITESTHPNGLCSFMRCPPPSFRQSEASVEWVIEATMSLGPDPTRDSIVSRFVFPVMPSGIDIGALRDEPFFGEDVGADLGSTEGTFVKTLNVHGRSVESDVRVLIRGIVPCLNLVKLHIPSGGMVSRDSPEFIMHLSLKLLDTPAQASILGLFRKNKPIVPRLARCSLHQSVSTRGGQETKPHKTSTLIRQWDINLSGADVGLRVVNELADLATNNIAIPFDLQTDGTYSKGTDRPMVPLATLVPSFRTPNIQLEYILVVSIFFVGDTHEYQLSRFPLQITPEDFIPADKLNDLSDSKLSL